MKLSAHALAKTALFAALTAVGAFIRIPTPFLSFTLQFFFTAAAGILLGARLGAISQAVYVALGLIGLPVFTQGGGPAYLLQPSCGFLIGLIPAAYLIGKLTEKGSIGFKRIFLACCAGLAVLYLIGLPYMYAVMNLYLGKGMTLAHLLWSGMLIFLPWDALKMLAASYLALKLRRIRIVFNREN